MGWIGCVRRKKFKRNFMVRTCALMAPVQPILHRVSYSNEILPNTSKHYETHRNMSLGSNGVDWVRSLRKNLMRLRGKNFCINCTSSARFAPSFVQKRNNPKCTQNYKTQQYLSLGSNGLGRVHSLRKIPKRLHCTNLWINCTSSTRFAPSFV